MSSVNSKLNVNNNKNNKFVKKKSFFNTFFKFDKLNATIKNEIIGGVSTFLAMVYIFSVEPATLEQASSIKGDETLLPGGIFLSTVIVSFITTFLMGAIANLPSTLAPSMGINAMFTFSVANGGGESTKIGYQGALLAVCISSILFLIFSLTKIRQLVIDSVPKSLQIAITAGIGCFIAYVGIAGMGWVTITSDGLPAASLSNLPDYYIGILLGMGTFLLILIFYFLNVPGAIAIGITIGLIISIILSNAFPNVNGVNSIGAIEDSGPLANAKWNGWNYGDLGDFSVNIKNSYSEWGNKQIWTSPILYISSLVFLLLTFFDATGTITSINNAVVKGANIKERKIPKAALIIDSSSSILASASGISHVSSFVESNVGIAAGARTGFASIISSGLILLTLPLYPLFTLIPSCISSAATLFVGCLMFGEIKHIEWNKVEIVFATFIMIIFMIITYDIVNGMALSIIVYSVIMVAKKQAKEISLIIWILDVVFILYFVAMAIMQVTTS